jgi:uncharacterized HAD superfamily protein
VPNVLRIGIDVDDVLVESLPEYLRLFRESFGHAVPLERAAWEIFLQFPHISVARIEAFYAELEARNFLETRPAYPEAVSAIGQLAARGHHLVVVTGRSAGHAEHTRRLLAAAGILDAFARVIHRDGEAARVYKPRVAREERLDLLIDDEAHLAVAVAAIPIPVLLMDRPWNQGEMPRGVTRVPGWTEILLQIERLAACPAEPGARWSADR